MNVVAYEDWIQRKLEANHKTKSLVNEVNSFCLAQNKEITRIWYKKNKGQNIRRGSATALSTR